MLEKAASTFICMKYYITAAGAKRYYFPFSCETREKKIGSISGAFVNFHYTHLHINSSQWRTGQFVRVCIMFITLYRIIECAESTVLSLYAAKIVYARCTYNMMIQMWRT